MKRSTWFDMVSTDRDGQQALTPQTRQTLTKLDDLLFALWNLGENVLLAWTRSGDDLCVLAVRHYEIAEVIDQGQRREDAATDLINGILAGPKHLPADQFTAACRALKQSPQVTSKVFGPGEPIHPNLISSLVRRYGVSLVTGRAVLLLDAVGFSLHP